MNFWQGRHSLLAHRNPEMMETKTVRGGEVQGVKGNDLVHEAVVLIALVLQSC